MSNPGTAIALAEPPDDFDNAIVEARRTMPSVRGYGDLFQPKNPVELIKIADYLAKSDAVPKSYQGKPHAIFVAGLAGAELGLSLMKSLQGIAVVNGVPSLYGKTAFAMVSRHQEYIDREEWDEGDPFDDSQDYVYHFILKRKGREPVHRSFSKREAQQITVQHGSGTRGSLWTKPGPWLDGYKKRMCKWRSFGYAAADQFSDALLGFGIVEEMIDVTPPSARIISAPTRTAALRETIAQPTLPPSNEPDASELIIPPSAARQAEPVHATNSADEATPDAPGASAEDPAPHVQPDDPFDAFSGAIEGAATEPTRTAITTQTSEKIRGTIDFTTARTVVLTAEQAGLSEEELVGVIHAHTGQYVLKKGASVTAIMNDLRARKR